MARGTRGGTRALIAHNWGASKVDNPPHDGRVRNPLCRNLKVATGSPIPCRYDYPFAGLQHSFADPARRGRPGNAALQDRQVGKHHHRHRERYDLSRSVRWRRDDRPSGDTNGRSGESSHAIKWKAKYGGFFPKMSFNAALSSSASASSFFSRRFSFSGPFSRLNWPRWAVALVTAVSAACRFYRHEGEEWLYGGLSTA
jgi:hypothetical protein